MENVLEQPMILSASNMTENRECVGSAETPLLVSVQSAYYQSLVYLNKIQQKDGVVAGEFQNNMMMTSFYVIMCHVIGHDIAPERRHRIHMALQSHVRSDGSWGIHPDSRNGYLFHTTLAYVALRLLGYTPANDGDPLTSAALHWIRNFVDTHSEGLAIIPTWGRIWLALLGLYPWSGIQPILPEVWLLPDATPMHPKNLFCHFRIKYLGLSYLYGTKYVAQKPTAIVEAIRSELYGSASDFRNIQFERYRNKVAETDVYETPGRMLRFITFVSRVVEQIIPAFLHQKALNLVVQHVLFEMRSTNYHCINAVSGMIFCLIMHHKNAQRPCEEFEDALQRCIDGLEYWIYESDENGMQSSGARCDTWDNSFVIQAIAEGPKLDIGRDIARKAMAWLVKVQHHGDLPERKKYYKNSIDGGWGFSDGQVPWPVSDCTAEALKAVLCSGFSSYLNFERKQAAIRFILTFQNPDGGFSTFEHQRGPKFLQMLNPSEMYGNCVQERSYNECTASCIKALYTAVKHVDLDVKLQKVIEGCVKRGKNFLLEQQDKRNGAWAASWGVHFTYGTFFAIEALLAVGLPAEHPSVARAVCFLLRSQREDGGWAESWESSLYNEEVFVPPEESSSVTQTAWAALTLMAYLAKVQCEKTRKAVDIAVAYLVQRQDVATGRWVKDIATGVVFNTGICDYTLYRQVFPMWALARYLKMNSSYLCGSN